MSIRGWLREPLVHFLIAGAVLFGFFAWKGEEVDPASREITIDDQALAGISLTQAQQMGRAPTDAELDQLVERYVREEVLYREALRLGLDQDDPVVRRRLAQKMDLIAAGRAEAAVPSDEVLQSWLQDHPERFADDAEYSFDQLWFAQKRQADEALQMVDGALEWRDLAATIELPASAEGMDRGELLDRFGQQFVRELDQLEPGEVWQGPIPSGLGWHVVRLRERTASSIPPLAEIRERVETDWRSATIARRKEDAYQILRDAYAVEIDR